MRLKKFPKKKRMSLGQAYYESLKLDWTHRNKVFIFFNKPKLKNLSGLMDIMPVFNNDEADNLNLIVRGIRNIIDN